MTLCPTQFHCLPNSFFIFGMTLCPSSQILTGDQTPFVRHQIIRAKIIFRAAARKNINNISGGRKNIIFRTAARKILIIFRAAEKILIIFRAAARKHIHNISGGRKNINNILDGCPKKPDCLVSRIYLEAFSCHHSKSYTLVSF